MNENDVDQYDCPKEGFAPTAFVAALDAAHNAAARCGEVAYLYCEPSSPSALQNDAARWFFFVGEPSELPAYVALQVHASGEVFPFDNEADGAFCF